MAQQPQAIWIEARAAGEKAAREKNAALGPENARGIDCGMAWVVIRPARGAFVTWCKKEGHGKARGYDGGFKIWCASLHDELAQSITVHEAAAQAFADVLRAHGIDASMDSRLD